VPKLADQGRYLASGSSFYRILRADGQQQQQHRGRAKPPIRRKPPTSYRASAPCEVWTWDITLMPGPVADMVFYLYLVVEIFSRKIIGWAVHERESADLAAALIRQTVLAGGCFMQPLVLHADNGSPPLVHARACTAGQCMKGATMKTTMEKPGIIASYSRPRVSNDDPFSEALFRTCKYRPDWPTKGFATRANAQAWVKSFASWYNGEQLHSAIRLVTPDDQIEYQVRDRLSVMRFLGLGDRVPDAKTVWLCRKALAKAGMVDELFAQFDGYPARQGYIARGGQILDASIVPVPHNHNKRA
jgi:putative transposase